MTTARIFGGGPFRGACTVPGDKSISHRALILASLAAGTSRLTGLSTGEDVRNTAGAIAALGATVAEEGDTVVVEGCGPAGWREPVGVLDFGNSGTGIRLMAGLLAAHPFFSVLDGDRYLRRRPMMRVVEPLRLMGADIDGRDSGRLPPLAVRGGGLQGISYSTPVASAQVKTCLLLAGLLAKGVTAVTEPALSRDHTEKLMAFLGIDLEVSGNTISLAGGQSWQGFELAVPGDPSAAAFPLAAALLVPGSEVTVENVCVNPTRTGFYTILKKMGARLDITDERLAGGETVATITARASRLRGIEVDPALVPSAIDEFPLLAALALFAEGRTTFRGAKELRVKESDRIGVMAQELGRLGAAIEEFDDGLAIEGGRPLRGASCDSRGDHRVAMSLAVAASSMEGELTIKDTDCIDTSFPGFWPIMANLGGRHEVTDE